MALQHISLQELGNSTGELGQDIEVCQHLMLAIGARQSVGGVGDDFPGAWIDHPDESRASRQIIPDFLPHVRSTAVAQVMAAGLLST